MKRNKLIKSSLLRKYAKIFVFKSLKRINVTSPGFLSNQKYYPGNIV